MTPESAIRNAICSWLKWHKAFVFVHDSVGIYDPIRKVYRTNHNPHRIKGVPDILGIWRGKFLGIEVKVKGSYPTPEQRAVIEAINDHGGIAFIARSIDDVKLKLEAFP